MQEELPVRPRCEIYFIPRFEREYIDEFFLYAILSKTCTKDLTAFYQDVNIRANTILLSIENRAHKIPSFLGCRPDYMRIAMAVSTTPVKEKRTSKERYVSVIKIPVLVSTHSRRASKIIGWVDPLLRVII
jgi:hypothetical protein